MRRVLLVCATICAAILAASAPAPAQDIKLRLSHSLSTTEPFHQASEFFARNVAQRTANRVEITIFPGEQLGPLKDVTEMVRQGSGVIVSTDSGYLADFVPDFSVLNGPYLLRNPDEFKKLLASDWYRELTGQAEKAGFKVLAFNWYFGSRHIISSKPIRTLDDIKGVSLRVPPVAMFIQTFQALGARGVTLQWSEVYNGLAQNVVDGAEAPLPTLYGSKLFEQRKVISKTGHFTAYLGLTMNDGVFRRFPTPIQAALVEEAVRAGEEMERLTKAKEAAIEKDFEAAGVTFIRDVDVASMQKATESVYGAFPKWTPGLHARIKQILAQ